MKYQVSILIPTFQRANLLKWNLFSLDKQNIPFKFETIVINDGTHDQTEAICEEYKEKLNIKYLFTGQRNLDGELKWRIPGFAINIGAKHSSGDVFIIITAEMFHLNDTIMKLAYPVLVDKTLIGRPIGKDDDGKFLRHINDTGNYDHNLFDKLPDLPTWLPFLLSLSREKFFHIGGYDEDFTGIAWDDNDLIDRLLMDGCNYYATDAKGIHLYHQRSSNLANKPEKYNMKLYLGRKGQIIRNKNREWGRMEGISD